MDQCFLNQTVRAFIMDETGLRPPHDVESGLAWKRTDSDLSSLPEVVDPEKRSAEDTGRTSTDASDVEAERDPDPPSRQRTRDDEPTGNNGVLSRVVSKVITRASTKSNLGPPPDGGLQAWMAGESDEYHPPSLAISTHIRKSPPPIWSS